MTLFGVSIILILGIINFFLIFLQLASGFRIIKFKPGIHKATGTILFITAFLHGLLAIIFR
jgi:hypothetical protein